MLLPLSKKRAFQEAIAVESGLPAGQSQAGGRPDSESDIIAMGSTAVGNG